jgi:hypothetical protein
MPIGAYAGESPSQAGRRRIFNGYINYSFPTRE